MKKEVTEAEKKVENGRTKGRAGEGGKGFDTPWETFKSFF